MEIGNENYDLVNNNKKSVVQYSCWILVSRKMSSTRQGINIKKLRHKMNANENKQFLCMTAVQMFQYEHKVLHLILKAMKNDAMTFYYAHSKLGIKVVGYTF